MIVQIITGVLIGLFATPKKRKKMNFTEKDAIAGIKAVAEKYGADAAAVVEKLYRLETDHFKSGNYRETGGAGMEATGAVFPYGWSLRDFWTANKHLRPTGVVRRKENQTGKSKMFIVFPNPTAGILTAAEVLRKRNWNAGAWYSNDESERARYNKVLASIKARFI